MIGGVVLFTIVCGQVAEFKFKLKAVRPGPQLGPGVLVQTGDLEIAVRPDRNGLGLPKQCKSG